MTAIAKSKAATSPENRSEGKPLLLTLAGLTTIGGFIADWNKTHLFNPKWTPHSKFHDAMSISLSSLLGLAGVYFLTRKGGDKKDNIALGAVLPGMFFTSMLSAFAYPGAKGLESEFPQKIPKVGKLWLNEGPISILMLTLLGIAYYKARNKVK